MGADQLPEVASWDDRRQAICDATAGEKIPCMDCGCPDGIPQNGVCSLCHRITCVACWDVWHGHGLCLELRPLAEQFPTLDSVDNPPPFRMPLPPSMR